MGSIYSFSSQESLTQNIYLTQDVNESYSTFSCHVAGVKIKFASHDQFVRRLANESRNCSKGNLKEHLDSVSSLEKYQPLAHETESVAQRYFFKCRSDRQLKSSLQSRDPATQHATEQTEVKNSAMDIRATQNITLLQRSGAFLIRCFMPCINIKR